MLMQSKKKVKKVNSQLKPKPTHFYLRIFSRHPSTEKIRHKILVPKVKAVYRHGSTTVSNFEYEVNSIDCIKNSADKLLMKKCFDKAEVHHAPWFHMSEIESKKKEFEEFLKKIDFEKDKESFLIIKNRWGYRGVGEISFG